MKLQSTTPGHDSFDGHEPAVASPGDSAIPDTGVIPPAMQQDMTWLRNAYAQLDAMGDAGDESKEYWRARQEIEDYAFARLPAFLDLLDAVSGQAKGVQRGDHASHS